MRSPTSTYYLAAARCRAGGPVDLMEISFQVAMTLKGGQARLLPAAECSHADLDVAVAEACATAATLVPPRHRNRLVVEAGLVEQRAEGPEGAVTRSERRYVLVTYRGVVMTLAERLAFEPDRCWDRIAGPSEIDPDVPVVLGESAVLALVEESFALAASTADTAGPSIQSKLLVEEAAESPYPPHALRTPLMDGARAPLSEASTDGSDLGALRSSAVALLLQPGRWSRPYAALTTDAVGCLAITAHSSRALPARALVVDSLLSLADGAGPHLWEAELSLLDPEYGLAAGAAPVTLILDARQVLANALGMTGGRRPALVRDPILGDRYGIAVSLLTDLSAGYILERSA